MTADTFQRLQTERKLQADNQNNAGRAHMLQATAEELSRRAMRVTAERDAARLEAAGLARSLQAADVKACSYVSSGHQYVLELGIQ
jgi:hypothetical protein